MVLQYAALLANVTLALMMWLSTVASITSTLAEPTVSHGVWLENVRNLVSSGFCLAALRRPFDGPLTAPHHPQAGAAIHQAHRHAVHQAHGVQKRSHGMGHIVRQIRLGRNIYHREITTRRQDMVDAS